MTAPRSSGTVDPVELSQRWLRQDFPPTDQQAAVIGAPAGPMLVVAGAGAGKTETMAARVVWLVANGMVLPEQVLGLTFTRKAARELGVRIRARLQSLASSGLVEAMPAITPTVSTYDSYAGDIVREYGLLLPTEPTGRLITDTERWMIARDVVMERHTGFTTRRSVPTIIDDMLELSDGMDNHLTTPDEVIAECRATAAEIDGLPDRDGKTLKGVDSTLERIGDALVYRRELLDVVADYRARLAERNLMTFGAQMSKAAQTVAAHPEVGDAQRRRFRVVMLDEYQDTGHAQRVLLRSLFGGGVDPGLTVTAVGDPMQSIYGFRGATAANLAHFRTDFPTGTGGDATPAAQRELTTSWRNPARVLDLANTVSRWSLDATGTGSAAVSPLVSRPGAGTGDVKAAWFDTREEELVWLADELAARYHHRDATREFSAAVLLRKNAEATPIHDLLVERGVPVEMSDGPGLLEVPEVADVYATLRVLVDPSDDIALLRLLTGVRWNIGAADLQALARRVDQLTLRDRGTGGRSGEDAGGGAGEDTDEPTGLTALVTPQSGDSPATATVRRRLADLDRDSSRVPVGLAEALADLRGMTEFGMSATGLERLSELGRELRFLRLQSLGKPLTDLVAAIEQMCGVRTEVLTRYHRDRRRSIGTSHLDRFAEVVRSFSDLSGASPGALVDYLRAAEAREKGLEAGEVEKRSDCVQLLTVHKAKGLEWEIVAVPHATRKTYADAVRRPTVESWTTNARILPSGLRGDATDDPTDTTGMPVLDLSDVVDRKGVVEADDAFKIALGVHDAKEDDRLFYVAVTRAEQTLLVSGAAFNNDAKKPVDPSVALTLIRDRLAATAPECIVTWSDLGMVYSKKELRRLAEAGEDGALQHREDALMVPENPAARNDLVEAYERTLPENPPAQWPRPTLTERLPGVAEGAGLVRAAMEATPGGVPEPDPGTLADQWARETALLVREHRAQTVPEVVVPLGSRLTATEAVALSRDPEEFARRRRRPVPLEPRPYTKRGTAFHNWVERHYGSVGLFDEDELPGAADATLADPVLATLKERFLASEWADRTPVSVEGSYSVTLAGHLFEGRIDAVFHDGDDPLTGWTVVDWKTGRKPTGRDLADASLQLAVYRLAWAKLLSARYGRPVDPADVRAAFHYVVSNETWEPGTLPSAEDLAGWLAGPDGGRENA
ncbi:UvrD-helicase domain-containing protein [uncultured Corynebacterium sp.]|uniref:UvrD-helicase domain-containing protein n=1 Tax=uncultured Corynebacterium sp. TaxID=159447 RepID=UPI0025E47305|nr:UvrD-helicase domain-containing protein [uncultured Corynebacterium sp.]